MKKKLVIFGLSDLARLAHFYFSTDSDYEICAFTVNKAYIKDRTFFDLPVVPFETITQDFPPDQHELFIALGYTQMNQLRAKYYSLAKEMGYKLATFISSKATVLTNQIGDNTFIFEDNTIQPYVKIGNDVILWSGNHIGHDAIIEDHCFITSHVVLAGWTRVGAYSFLGINSTIRDKVTIGESSLIAAGALIVKDTAPKSIYKGKVAERSDVTTDQIEGI